MNKTVALVIGHTEENSGAYNKDLDITEYSLNKQEAIKVSKLLDNMDIPNILIYRRTYETLPGDINLHNPDLIVSFHHNAFNDSSTGTETLYFHSSEKGKKLAAILQDNSVLALEYKDRGIKPKDSEDRGGYVLEYTNAPCVILEPCFMSNTRELEDFIVKQDKYTEAIAEGIKTYIELV